MRSPSLAFGNKHAVGFVLLKTNVFYCPVGESTAFRNLIRKTIPEAQRTGALIKSNRQWTGIPTIRPVAGVGRWSSRSFFS